MLGRAMSQRPLVSVIIPVFNDSDSLKRCLNLLSLQTYPKDSFEIIVVDNGSAESPSEASSGIVNCRLLSTPKKGSYCARNRGLEDARGSIIAFTDADCRPEPDWIESGVSYLETHPECSYLGGLIELEYRDPSRKSASEVYESLHAFRQKGFVEQVGFAATANLFVRQAVFDTVGGFKESLRSGGDMEFGRRALGAGFGQAYSPRTVIRHDARYRYLDLRKRELRKVGGLLPNLLAKRGTLMAVLMILAMPSPRLMRDGGRPAQLHGFREMSLYIIVVGALRVARAVELMRLSLGGEPRR